MPLYISEYYGQGKDERAVAPVVAEPAIVNQTVAIGGSSAQSSAFNTHTRIVRLHADAVCSVRFGANPTAAATDARMAAGQTEYFAVRPGDRVAVIQNT